LFYTDWDAPAKIARLDMDGQNQKILIEGKNIEWPNGLAIDNTKVYWADARFDRIESINFDGTDRKVIRPSTQHIFGLAVDKNYIYWSDWLSQSIHRIPKFSSGNNDTDQQFIRRDFSGLMEIQIYDKDLQLFNRTLRGKFNILLTGLI